MVVLPREELLAQMERCWRSRRDASAEEIEREIKGMGLGPLNRFMVRWTFKNMLLKNAYSVEDMRSMISRTPFGKCEINLDGVGFQIWLRK